MPRQSKVTKEVKSIQQIAKEAREEELVKMEDEPAIVMTGEPEDAKQTSTEEQLADVFRQYDAPQLLTLHLRRVGAELTDPSRTVHIPAPAILKEGEKVVLIAYREA